MRFRHPDGTTIHLAYCSNVHRADDAAGVLAQLARFAGPVREQLGVARLGLGLWLSAQAAATLDADRAQLSALRSELDRLGLEVVTLNGFPYGDFHADTVKYAVYSPDWTTPERAEYTVRLARLLVALLPDDVTDGSISTLPLGWRTGWTALQTAAAQIQLREVADELATLQASTGRTIRLALEPEPGCIIENTSQLTEFLSDLGAGDWIGACIDTAHLTVQFEAPASSITAVAGETSIVKAQVSAGLRVPDPAPQPARARLASFVEQRFLHQTRTVVGGSLLAVDDLDLALDGGLPTDAEWRVHVHVPLHADPSSTTADEVRSALATLIGAEHPLTRHLEVETYTWTVLPADLRPVDDADLVAGIARELEWTRTQLTELGLGELP